MNELNDDWLYWPPDAIDGFFNGEGETEKPSGVRTTSNNNTHEENQHENRWHAFFS